MKILSTSSKMMPVRGLKPEEVTFPRLKLPTKFGAYLSTIVLSMWDNIHGPKIIAVWQGDDPQAEAQEEVEGTCARCINCRINLNKWTTMQWM